MDNKNKKQQGSYSSDGEANESLPGYPHYPASEDITRAKNNSGKISTDGGAAAESGNIDEEDDEVSFAEGTDADVTREDLRMLDAAEQNMDTPDDENLMRSALDDTDEDGEPLNEESIDYDMTGEDLDVPGSEADNMDEEIGEEDEENNYYSLGGDNHESQEEDKGD